MARKTKINILFTCVGRRVALVESFRLAADRLGMKCRIVGTDVDRLSPALYVCDEHLITSPIHNRRYIPQLAALIEKHKIDLLVPTIDTELKSLSDNKDRLERAGARVLVSAPEVIEICQDKRKTYKFLLDHEFGTPATWIARNVKPTDLRFPVFLKPWDGSASKGNAVARHPQQVRYWKKQIPNCLIQEFIRGQEYTCDVYVDFSMRVRCVVPRKRIQARAGEVSKGQTVKRATMMRQCKRLVETLGAGPGVITIQCFLGADGQIKFIEINPRFGGGVPLSIKAGADFPKWLLQELSGRRPRIKFDAWQDRFYMLRYDDAVWCTQTSGRTLRATRARPRR